VGVWDCLVSAVVAAAAAGLCCRQWKIQAVVDALRAPAMPAGVDDQPIGTGRCGAAAVSGQVSQVAGGRGGDVAVTHNTVLIVHTHAKMGSEHSKHGLCVGAKIIYGKCATVVDIGAVVHLQHLFIIHVMATRPPWTLMTATWQQEESRHVHNSPTEGGGHKVMPPPPRQ